jgi:hypothetical protein
MKRLGVSPLACASPATVHVQCDVRGSAEGVPFVL